MTLLQYSTQHYRIFKNKHVISLCGPTILRLNMVLYMTLHAKSQNRDHTESRLSQKSVTAATPSFGMIRHQNALVMFLASVLMRGTHPLNVRHFEYFHWDECLSQAHWLGICMATVLQRLRQNHRRIQEVCFLCSLYSVEI